MIGYNMKGDIIPANQMRSSLELENQEALTQLSKIMAVSVGK
jgi:hypothetical protein